MNIVQYFKQGAEFWVSKINTEGKLTDEEVKLASGFCSNAFKWDCDSCGERVAKELQNKGYNFTIPLFLFENVDNAKAYESAQEEFIREIKRNVRLAHKREELIR